MTDPAYLAFEAYANFLYNAIIGIPSEILAANKDLQVLKIIHLLHIALFLFSFFFSDSFSGEQC